MRYIYTSAVTLLALLLYMAVSLAVGQARAKYRVKAPAVTGHEHFERAYRVHRPPSRDSNPLFGTRRRHGQPAWPMAAASKRSLCASAGLKERHVRRGRERAERDDPRR
jgi:hypothetical protein